MTDVLRSSPSPQQTVVLDFEHARKRLLRFCGNNDVLRVEMQQYLGSFFNHLETHIQSLELCNAARIKAEAQNRGLKDRCRELESEREQLFIRLRKREDEMLMVQSQVRQRQEQLNNERRRFNTQVFMLRDLVQHHGVHPEFLQSFATLTEEHERDVVLQQFIHYDRKKMFEKVSTILNEQVRVFDTFMCDLDTTIAGRVRSISQKIEAFPAKCRRMLHVVRVERHRNDTHRLRIKELQSSGAELVAQITSLQSENESLRAQVSRLEDDVVLLQADRRDTTTANGGSVAVALKPTTDKETVPPPPPSSSRSLSGGGFSVGVQVGIPLVHCRNVTLVTDEDETGAAIVSVVEKDCNNSNSGGHTAQHTPTVLTMPSNGWIGNGGGGDDGTHQQQQQSRPRTAPSSRRSMQDDPTLSLTMALSGGGDDDDDDGDEHNNDHHIKINSNQKKSSPYSYDYHAMNDDIVDDGIVASTVISNASPSSTNNNSNTVTNTPTNDIFSRLFHQHAQLSESAAAARHEARERRRTHLERVLEEAHLIDSSSHRSHGQRRHRHRHGGGQQRYGTSVVRPVAYRTPRPTSARQRSAGGHGIPHAYAASTAQQHAPSSSSSPPPPLRSRPGTARRQHQK